MASSPIIIVSSSDLHECLCHLVFVTNGTFVYIRVPRPQYKMCIRDSIYCMYGLKYDEKHYDAKNNKYYYVIPWK